MVVLACSPSVGKADRRILGLAGQWLTRSLKAPQAPLRNCFLTAMGTCTHVCLHEHALTPQVQTDTHVHTHKYTQNIDI